MAYKGGEGRPERVDYLNISNPKILFCGWGVYPKRKAGGPSRKHFIYFKIWPKSSSRITTNGNEQNAGCR